MEENKSEKIKLPQLDYRIPKWNFDKLKERVCPICNFNDSSTRHIRPDLLTVKFCNICNTFFISPAPSQQQLSLFYVNYDENHRRDPHIATKKLVNSYKHINPLADFRIQKLSNYISFKNSKILDVGFGRAKLLYSLLKLGAITFGIELDEKAIEYAKALGIQKVNKCNIEDLNNDTRFNLIIFDDLIEHPLHPMSLIKKASDILEDKGLLMIWTPNGKTSINEIYPTTFRVDLEHMQYLTPESCEFIANEVNLKIIHLETLGFPHLKGLEKPLKTNHNFKINLKKTIKLIPGAIGLYKLLKKFRQQTPSIIVDEENKGDYHLFCIMQKSVR